MSSPRRSLLPRLAALALMLGGCDCGEDPPVTDGGGPCRPVDCSDRGLNCGSIRDEATGECLFCGNCQGFEICGAGGVPNVCGCTPKTCEEQGFDCGEAGDTCGGTIQCGECTDPEESCAGGGVDNKCGLTRGLDEPCADRPESCEGAGLLCCPIAGVQKCARPKNFRCPEALPDLIVDVGRFYRTTRIETASIAADDCSIGKCVDTPGLKRLLRFGTLTLNLGPADWELGNPDQSTNFEWSQCEERREFNAYLAFRLLDASGAVRARGRKSAFCITDTERIDPAAPAEGIYNCGPTDIQGIQAGWADFYEADLTCQWLDITGVPPGEYIVEQHVNPERLVDETNYDNNTATISVTIPP